MFFLNMLDPYIFSLYFLDCDVKVISGDVYDNDKRFKVEEAFYRAEKEEWGKSYWCAPDKMPGQFILDLGCEDSYNTVELVNLHNGPNRDRSTERFQVFLRYSRPYLLPLYVAAVV